MNEIFEKRIDRDQPGDPIPDWNARLLAIYISEGHDYWGKQGEGRMTSGVRDVADVECVAGKGLVGDRYFASRKDLKGQVTFFEARVVEGIRSHFKLPKLPASVFRRNLIVDQVNLREWIGRQFRFQGLIFEGAQECKPCHWMDRVVETGVQDYLKKEFRGGLRARVISGGFLRRDS